MLAHESTDQWTGQKAQKHQQGKTDTSSDRAGAQLGKNQVGSCDGQFYESAWLGYTPVIRADTNADVGGEDTLWT